MAKEENSNQLNIADSQLAFQNSEKEKRKAELITANKELTYQNSEKEKLAAELIIANKKLVFQNREILIRASELITANKDLSYKNTEKHNLATDLFVVNKKLAIENEDIRTSELEIANKELGYQYSEKEKLVNELLLANKELAYQNSEIEMLANELFVANKELVFINVEKEKRAAELIIANEELAYQNSEKENRATELLIANKELTFLNAEKHKRAAELIISNKELSFQNAEKEKRANQLILINTKLNKTKLDLSTLNEELEQKVKERTEKLSLSEAFNAGVLNSLTSHIAVLDKNGNIVAVNNSWINSAKENGEDSLSRIGVGSNYLAVCKKAANEDVEEGDAVANAIQGILDKKIKHFYLEYPCHSPTEQRWFALRVVKFESDQPMVVISHQNITERKEAEQKLSASLKELEDYKFALDQSSIVDIADEKGKIKYVNDNFISISKFSREELIGQDHTITNFGYDDGSFIQNLRATIVNGKIWKGELKNKAKDGSIYWVETTIVPFLNNEDKPYQYISIRNDITERHKHQITIEAQNEKLRDIAWTQSHIVRAPLARMLGLLNIMEMDSFKSHDFPQLVTHFKNSLHELDDVIMEIVQKTQSLDL